MTFLSVGGKKRKKGTALEYGIGGEGET